MEVDASSSSEYSEPEPAQDELPVEPCLAHLSTMDDLGITPALGDFLGWSADLLLLLVDVVLVLLCTAAAAAAQQCGSSSSSSNLSSNISSNSNRSNNSNGSNLAIGPVAPWEFGGGHQ